MDNLATGESRILIVDDDPDTIQLVASYLEDEGYDLYVAKNGEEALRKVRDNEYDLLLLDVVMPDLNGREVCRRLKSNEDGSDLPIVFLTSQSDPEKLAEGFEVGAADYISKPVTEPELTTRVRHQLELVDYRESMEKLVDEKTSELERKNMALKELLDQYEEHKEEAVEHVTENLESFILPSLRKLNGDLPPEKESLLETVQESLQDLSNPFTSRLREFDAGLTGKEIEICHYVRQGLTTDEISGILHVEPETVKWHRGNIREKLGLKHEDVTLNEYLNQL